MRWLYFFAVVFLMTACAQKGDVPTAAGLHDRVSQVLDARVQKDWSQVYDIADEDYKKNVSREQFLGMNRGMTFLKYEILSVEENDADNAQAVIVWSFMMGGYNFDNQKEHQRWVRENGSWNIVMARDEQFGF